MDKMATAKSVVPLTVQEAYGKIQYWRIWLKFFEWGDQIFDYILKSFTIFMKGPIYVPIKTRKYPLSFWQPYPFVQEILALFRREVAPL
jgi:hypothetical protein